jgi:Protein of Unknown function (DUF2784)
VTALYRLIAELTMLLHFAFLAYLVLGGFLAWWRPWLFIPHAVVVAWGVLSVAVGMECPLSLVEDWARVQAGQSGLADAGFIETYLTGVVYPAEHLGLVRALVAVVVALSWLGFAVRQRRRRRASDRRDRGSAGRARAQ